MEVTTEEPKTIRVVIEATPAELALLHDATRKGRRSHAEDAALQRFGSLLGGAAPEVLRARPPRAKKARKAKPPTLTDAVGATDVVGARQLS